MPTRVFLVKLEVESELPADLKSFAREVEKDLTEKGWSVVEVKTWGDNGGSDFNFGGQLGGSLGDFVQ